jgi:hypothetical protein
VQPPKSLLGPEREPGDPRLVVETHDNILCLSRPSVGGLIQCLIHRAQVETSEYLVAPDEMVPSAGPYLGPDVQELGYPVLLDVSAVCLGVGPVERRPKRQEAHCVSLLLLLTQHTRVPLSIFYFKYLYLYFKYISIGTIRHALKGVAGQGIPAAGAGSGTLDSPFHPLYFVQSCTLT